MPYNPWDAGSSAADDDDDIPHSPRGERPVPPPPPPGPGVGNTFLQSCLVAGCVTIFVPVLLVGGFFVLMFFMASSSLEDASKSSLGSIYSTGGGSNLRERVIRQGSGGPTVAIVTIQGAIDGGGSPLEGEGMLSYVSQQLEAAGEDDNVKAVILQIDSPGGGLTASDQLYHEVLRLREKGKPVLAWAGSMMASGGYYIAVAADEIMATPTSTVGSIGVIMQHFQVRDLMEKIGIKVDPITSGEHKDLASPFREMTPEERSLLQDYINTAHSRFVEVVAKGRNMSENQVRALADGGIFPAEKARERGLVDSIGYIEDAVAWAEGKTGRKNMRVVSYRRMVSFGDFFREAGRGAAGAVIDSAAADSAPRAMAVWDGRGD